MKEKFLKLVEEVSKTGIAWRLCNCTSADELRGIQYDFVYENKLLIDKISTWEQQAFVKMEDIFHGKAFIFKKGEEVKNPIEMAVAIYLLPSLTETEIFENWEDLYRALHNLNLEFASAIADIAWGKNIKDITIKDIFEYIK